jgi:hypothetical protein
MIRPGPQGLITSLFQKHIYIYMSRDEKTTKSVGQETARKTDLSLGLPLVPIELARTVLHYGGCHLIDHWEDQDVGGWTILKWILER